MNITETAYTNVYWYKITVKPKQSMDPIEVLIWQDLPFDIRNKYTWYFNYRAALLQVKYPKYIVECNWGSEKANKKVLHQSLKNRIIKRKAQITELTNKLVKAKIHWNSLFAIEDDLLYKQAVAKINKLKFELQALEQEFKEINLSNDQK